MNDYFNDDNYHQVELNKTIWRIPKRYQMLSPVGSGAYGQVWYDLLLLLFYVYATLRCEKIIAGHYAASLTIIIKKLTINFSTLAQH